MSRGERVERDIDRAQRGQPTVAASRTSPERTVFTEHGNTDAWIATDVTVDLER